MKKIFGRKPILEALRANENIEQIYVSFGQKGDVIAKIKNLAKKNGIKYSEVSTSKFREIDPGKNTQGIIALKSDRKYYSIDELLKSIKNENPLLLLMDSIQDPHNVGAIFRTAECAGVDGVIITTHNSAPITDTAEKISAGAVSHLKICKVNNLSHTMGILKEEGFWITGTALSENSKDFTEIDFTGSTAIVMGNEEKGLKSLVAKNCDFLTKIPMQGQIQSLNVSVATGVILFEALKQRKKS